MLNKKLHVIAVISNPVRYESRYRLYRQFEEHMKSFPDVVLYTVEAAFGDRPYRVTEAGNPLHLQLRTWDELWHKENMINLGVQRLLPSDWEYLAWIDADIEFLNPNWAKETIQALQHHMIVQPFQDAIDMGPGHEVLEHHKSFCYMYRQGGRRPKHGEPYQFWHPGFAWAIRREAWDMLGGIIDSNPCILGSADHSMALALIGEAWDAYPGWICDNYKRPILDWQRRAQAYIKRDIGFISGTVRHYFHGAKRNRNYRGRWEILKKYAFDPCRDLKRDWQGLWQLEVLEERQIGLRDAFRDYFRSRNEDSPDTG